MTKFKTFFAGTALAALMALPGFAEGTVPTTDIQAAVMAYKAGESNVGTAPGQTSTAASEAFVGNAVTSSDGTAIGTVQKSAVTAEGLTILLVQVGQEAGTKAEFFTVTLAPTETADGQVELPWTKADMVGALDAQIASKAGSGG